MLLGLGAGGMGKTLLGAISIIILEKCLLGGTHDISFFCGSKHGSQLFLDGVLKRHSMNGYR